MSWFGSLKCLPVRRRKAVRRLPHRGLTGFEVLETRAAPSGALLGGAAAATTAALLDGDELPELQRPLKKRDSSKLLGLDFLWALENRIERLLELLRNTLPQTDQAARLPSVQQVRDQLVQQQGFLRKLQQEKQNYVLRVGLKRQQDRLRLVFQAQFQQDSTRYKASFYWGAALAAAGQAAGSDTPQARSSNGGGGAPPPGGGGYVDAVDDFFSVLHDTTFSDTVAWNDLPPGLSYKLVSNVSNGTLKFYSDGGFDYTPKPNWVGFDSFVYEATDGTNTDQATVTIEVTNSPPVAEDDYFAPPPNQAFSDNVMSNDSDPDYYDQTRLVTTVVDPPDNAAEFNLNPDGGFDYTPEFGFVGVDTFVYRLSDGIESDADTATVTLNVGGLTDLDLLHMAAVPECGCTCSAKITAGPGG